MTASPAWRRRAPPRAGDVATMRRRTAELGRRRTPQSKTFFGPRATPQDNQPTNHAMAITQIHTLRRNRYGSWRDSEGGALDARRPLGSFCERCHRNEPIQRRAADATLPSLRLHGAPQLRRRPAERSAGGKQQRQRQRAQEDEMPSLSPRQWPASSPSRTRPEATRASRTVHSRKRSNESRE